KEEGGGNHRPLEDDEPQALVARLPGARIERKRHGGCKQQHQGQPAEDQHHQALAGCAKPPGAWRSSSKVTTSQASRWASSARSSWLFIAWPERNALYAASRGLPMMYRSPMASRILCLTNSSS